MSTVYTVKIIIEEQDIANMGYKKETICPLLRSVSLKDAINMTINELHSIREHKLCDECGEFYR